MTEKEVIDGLEYEIKLIQKRDRFAAKDISSELLCSALALIKQQKEIIDALVSSQEWSTFINH